jgi:hypothetical protein
LADRVAYETRTQASTRGYERALVRLTAVGLAASNEDPSSSRVSQRGGRVHTSGMASEEVRSTAAAALRDLSHAFAAHDPDDGVGPSPNQRRTRPRAFGCADRGVIRVWLWRMTAVVVFVDLRRRSL